MNFRQFIALILARKWLFLSVFAAVVIATMAFTFSQPRLFTGSAQVLVQGKGADGAPIALPENYLATQTTLITSERVGLRAVEILGLTDSPEFQQAYGGGKLSPEVLARAIANGLSREIDVKPVRESSALTISYRDGNRERVADVANAYMQAYIDISTEIRANPDKAGGSALEAEATRLRGELETLQNKLADMEQSRGIASNTESNTVENTRLQQMAAELTRLEREVSESQRVVAGARASIDNYGSGSPEVMKNPVVGQLQREQLRLEQQIADLSRKFGPEHPNMASAKNELNSVNRRLRNAVSSTVSVLVRDYEALRRRENDLRAGLEKQRGRLVSTRQNIEAAQNLRRDVENARRAYESAQAQVNKSAISARTVQADLVPLSPAITPTLPSSPNFNRNGAIGVVLGTLLALGAVVMAEASRPRVRLPDDLERLVRAPVVGVLSNLPKKTLALAGNDERSSGARRRLEMSRREQIEHQAKPAPSGKTDLAQRPKADTGHPVLDALLDAGLIAPKDTPAIQEAAERDGLRLGDAAVATGLVKAKDLRNALARHADYPLLDPDNSVVSHEVFAAFDVNHPFLDELRRLRAQVKARWFDGRESRERPGRTLAVLSEGRGQGKTFTAANLAVSFAQMGELTLLIDGDIWGGRLHDVFALDNSQGFSTLLSRRCNPRDVFREIKGLDGLTVIPSGPEVPNASDLLAGHTTELLLKLFERAFDVIIIDTPSADGKPDAALIANKAGGYIVVARQNQTLTRAMAQLVRTLEPMGAKLVGTVLMRA